MADNAAAIKIPVLIDRRTTGPAPSRTVAIWDEVRKRLEERRALFDSAEDLGSVCIEIRLHAGTNVVKSSSVTEERFNRRLPFK